jgi:CheY-like chemotaxis protein
MSAKESAMPGKKVPRTVLVVDDEASVRQMLSRLLESCGYRVLTAANGREALQVFNTQGPVDLLVLDVMMPEMDGYEALARLKKLADPAPHVVMLTAQQQDGEILKGYQAGADYYVTKPLKTGQLLNIVNYLIGDLSAAERARLETKL